MNKRIRAILYGIISRFYLVVLAIAFFMIYLIMQDTGLIKDRVYPYHLDDLYGLTLIVFPMLGGTVVGVIEDRKINAIALGVISGVCYMFPFLLWIHEFTRLNPDFIRKSGGVSTGNQLMITAAAISFLSAISTYTFKKKVLEPLKESVKEKAVEAGT